MQSNKNTGNEENLTKDRFYPNAVYCLLELYHRAYQKHLKGQYELDDDIWSEIAMEMQESFFIFDSAEVKKKFKQLRDNYFNLSTVNALRSFEYFEPMHNIYKDLQNDILLQESTVGGDIFFEDYDEEAALLTKIKPTYADEILFQEPLKNTTKENNVSYKQPSSMWIKIEHQDKQCDNTAEDDSVPAEKSSKLNFNSIDNKNDNTKDNNNIHTESITLHDLNLQQERRHREQIKLWRQMLRQQECIVDQQRLLLEMFSKRF